jgi:hypothetical protein
MRRIACLLAILALAAPAQAQTQTQQTQMQSNVPPHAWLFGEWTGGLFPAPSVLNAQECLALPVVIFTRDIVMRAVVTDQFYDQRLVETARVTAEGAEFRFTPAPVRAPTTPFNPIPQGATGELGFGCISPDVLRVQRRTENEITFPDCKDFPYPLVRCPAR